MTFHAASSVSTASHIPSSTLKLNDFDFEVGLNVVGFNIKVTGKPTVVVQGSKLNAQAQAVIAGAGRGDQVTISEIKVNLVGAPGYLLPKTSVVIYEIQ